MKIHFELPFFPLRIHLFEGLIMEVKSIRGATSHFTFIGPSAHDRSGILAS